MPLEFLLLIGVALLVAGMIGLFIYLLRTKQNDTRIEAELRRQLVQTEAEVLDLRNSTLCLSKDLAQRTAECAAKTTLLEQQDAFYKQQLADAKSASERALAELRTTFKALSADALKEQAPTFLQLATATFAKVQEGAKGDLTQRQEAIQAMLTPFKEQLEAYRQQLQQAERNHAEAQATLKKEIEGLTENNRILAEETARFRTVMKSSQARGKWGETTLRNVVEAANMSVHCDFIEQAVEGESKPDMLIKLPGDRTIVVDAKTPELDYLTHLDSADEITRSALLAEYVQKLRQTIVALARREYTRQFANTLDYVILFLPAESLFSTALEGDPELVIWAAKNHHIMLATPASLLAMLGAVRVTWSNYKQAENAKRIADEAQELYTRIQTFLNHFAKIRKGLADASEAYNKAIASYESRIRPSGEKLVKLGIADQQPLTEIQELTQPLRTTEEEQNERDQGVQGLRG